jgi:hypothetical protein
VLTRSDAFELKEFVGLSSIFFSGYVKDMSAASHLSTQASQHCDSEDEMADQPQSKRARVEIQIPAFAEVDLTKFSLKDNGKGKNGHLSYPLIDGQVVRFNLTPSGWLKSPFGFDIQTKYEKPSFLGGKEPEKPGAPEGLNLRINLGDAEAEFLSELDTHCSTEFEKLAKAKWNSLVTEGNLFSKSSTKVMVVLKGNGLTQIAVVDNNKVLRGEGWDFLKQFLDSGNNFKQSDVKLVAKAQKLWNVSGGAGIKLEATQIVLRTTERPKDMSVFVDDDELLA